MFSRLGDVVSRHFTPVILLWVALAAALHVVAPRWDDVTHDGDLAYLPESMPSARGMALLHEAFPDERARSEMAIIVERPGRPLSTEDLLWSDSLAVMFREHADDLELADVWNRNTDVVGSRLTSRRSEAGQAAVTLLKIKDEFMATSNVDRLDEVRALLAKAEQDAPPGLQVGISGSAAIAGDMLQSASESIRNTEWTTVVLVVLILLAVYRAPLLVLVPMVSIGTALIVSIDVLALLTQLKTVPGFDWWHFKVFTTTKIFIVVILFGSGTDFCLFLIARYREELSRGLGERQAVAEAVGRVSEALLGSAATTIVGLSMMFFADFGKFRSSGPAIAMCLAITLLACLTLAPALLSAAGRVIFWPFGARAIKSASAEGASDDDARWSNRFWGWIAGAIVARPGLILVSSIALLAPLAYRGTSVQMTYDLLGELSPKRTSVLGTAVARRHFAPGEMAPITLLVYQQGAEFDTKAGENEIGRLTKLLYDMDGIESVRSITEPTGERPGYFNPFRARGLQKLAARKHKISEARFLTPVRELEGEVARLDLVFSEEPFSPGAVETLDAVEARLKRESANAESDWHGADFVFVGTTVGVRDLAAVTASDQRLIQRLVVLTVLGVLILLLRRPLICLYLILSVLFSYLVTIGVTQIFFAWAYGSTYYGLDWKVPIFLFVILVAVGEDYNIYLVTRVLEEQRKHGPLPGLRRAVAKTGGIITACGAIMAGTFISMTTGTLRGITELGFALSLGIVLDTCIVRPILVPAFLALLERYSRRPPSASVAPHQPAAERAQHAIDA
ncbi:MAG: MMPL family transporter [Planctomycetota bacterium]|nr:MAG: MMPL family transporter [Planctomycetota bacterium]